MTTHKLYCRILTRLGWPLLWRRPRKKENIPATQKVCRVCKITAEIKLRKVTV